jgi:hypothetical protein
LTKICIKPATLPTRHLEFLMYVDFVSYYVSAVIGLRDFEKYKCQKLYREYVSVSDEAFAVLTLENNWDRWMEMAANDEWTTASVPTKWTVSRDRTASSAKKARARLEETGIPQARRYRGWSPAGINRYNQLYDQLEVERASARAVLFEENLLRHFRHEEEIHSSNKKQKGVPREAAPMPMPRHASWSTDTIISSAHFKPPQSSHNSRDESSNNNSDAEQDEGDKLPDYSRSEGVKKYSI